MDLTPDKPIAGILAPLFALRGPGDLGVGDTRALKELIDWAAGRGFRLIQLLPINETGNDNSPYNAISSVAIEPTTLETTPASIDDLTQKDYDAVVAGYDIDAMCDGPVNYRKVGALKRALLERAFERFTTTQWQRKTRRAKAFEGFMKDQGDWLEGYTLFRALMDVNDGSELWDQWGKEHRSVERARAWVEGLSGAEAAKFESRRQFFAYVQWVAFGQWSEVKAYAHRQHVALMGDVPYGVSYYSADVYSTPQIFDLKWSGGAPPEPYFKDDEFTQKWGQNWGVPVYRWSRMKEGGYAWWRQRVRAVRGVFHLFRVDHVLGFYRIYAFPWRPKLNPEFLPLDEEEAKARTGGKLPHFVPRDDDTPEHQRANRRDGERYLRALVEEVGEFRLIGEDLGTVPPYVRPSLTSLSIAGFKIPIWEKKDDGWLIEPWNYDRLSVATYATHDHEPLKAFWERRRREMALNAEPGLAQDARDELTRLAGFASIPNGAEKPWGVELHGALLEALCRSNSWIVIFMITDLLGSDRRFNVPGTAADSNWSARLSRRCAEWGEDKETRPVLERISGVLRETNRA